MEYISLQYIEDAFAACENNLKYRSLLAIARYEGLRVPSEIRDLKFSDFRNIEKGIIFTVPDSGKTGKRQVPVFEEFLPYLDELRKHRKEGQVELFEHCRKGKNVGTLLKKFHKNLAVPAGLETAPDGRYGTTLFCSNSFALIILESFLISLTIRFTIFEQSIFAQRNDISLILSDVPANFTHKKTAALSPIRPFEFTKERIMQ